MVAESSYIAESGEFKTEFTNYRVVVGPGEEVDKLDSKMKELLPEGLFKIENRIHKM